LSRQGEYSRMYRALRVLYERTKARKRITQAKAKRIEKSMKNCCKKHANENYLYAEQPPDYFKYCKKRWRCKVMWDNLDVDGE